MGEHLIDDRTRVLAATRREDVGFQAAGAEGLSVKDIDKGEVSPGLRRVRRSQNGTPATCAMGPLLQFRKLVSIFNVERPLLAKNVPDNAVNSHIPTGCPRSVHLLCMSVITYQMQQKQQICLSQGASRRDRRCCDLQAAEKIHIRRRRLHKSKTCLTIYWILRQTHVTDHLGRTTLSNALKLWL